MVFIVIDGLDASGKSTQATLLSSFLKRYGHSVFLRVHPAPDNFFGRKTEFFLLQRGRKAHFNAALFYMIDVIRSVLLYGFKRFDFMIFVRYLMGTAYLPSPLHSLAYHFFSMILPTSSFMFFLDITPPEAHRRLQLRNAEIEMFETLKDLEKTRLKALTLAKEDNWQIIDADRSVAEIQTEIRRIISSKPKAGGAHKVPGLDVIRKVNK